MKNKFREQVAFNLGLADGLKPTLQRAHLKATLFSRKVCFSTAVYFLLKVVSHKVKIYQLLEERQRWAELI